MFQDSYYQGDQPRLFNCVADTADVLPSTWDAPFAWADVFSPGAQAPVPTEELDQLLREEHGYEPATWGSLREQVGRGERKLALAVYAHSGNHTYLHVFWLDGKGRWVSKPGILPVQLLTSRRLLTRYTVKVDGVKYRLLGLYWVPLRANPTRLRLYQQAVAEAKVHGRPVPRY